MNPRTNPKVAEESRVARNDPKTRLGPGTVLFHDPNRAADGRWLCFERPVRIVQTFNLTDVVPMLGEVERATAEGLFAAGFISYEAAPAMDSALARRETSSLPLLWFGLYESSRCSATPPSVCDINKEEEGDPAWSSSVSPADYEKAFGQIKRYIARGDTYQVNYTFQLQQPQVEPVDALFRRLCHTPRVPKASKNTRHECYSALLDTGDHLVCSASPELFFRLEGDQITCRPMKGTASRGRTLLEDRQHALWLQHSSKNRAENVMIVDMVRNDLGRIAKPGTVDVESLFDVAKYDTLFQMTSTVSAKTDASVTDIFRALFPCASVTGAPKVRTSAIIRELETEARGVYTGAIGYLAPKRKALFNVAIRTAHVDRKKKTVCYGIGGGIVWDSDPAQEYEECRTKALVATKPTPEFSLLETILWTEQEGFSLLAERLDRLRDSAEYFDIPLSIDSVISRLDGEAATFQAARRIRLLVGRDGSIHIEHRPADVASPVWTTPMEHPRTATGVWRIGLAREPVHSGDRFLYHKTTHRAVYEPALSYLAGRDMVVLWNERGEITETPVANIVMLQNGRWVTPPVSCGLLPGTLRARLLRAGVLHESIITKQELEKAESCYLINSVRGWIPTEFDF